MRSSNIGYFLLAGVVFTMPGCKIQAHLDDDDAGSGGESAATGGGSGKGGSAGQGGTGGSAGRAASGGTSGAAEAGAAGSPDAGGAAGSTDNAGAGAGGMSGTGGSSATCDTSGFEFPEVTCATGSLSELTNPTCQDVLLCMGLADCASSQMDCAECLDYVKAAFESTNTCIQAASQATLTEACKSIAADSADEYPQCVPK